MFYMIIHDLLLRTAGAFFTALILGWAGGRPLIHYLQKLQIGQVIRQLGPKSHYSKQGTPTMGGLLILVCMMIACLLWGNLSDSLFIFSLLVTLAFGAIGFWDDYKKLILKHSRGLASRWKYFWQTVFALIAAFWLYRYLAAQGIEPSLYIPYWHHTVPLGVAGFIILTYFVIVGSSNAVNLTDGLDGLVIGLVMMVAAALAAFVYLVNRPDFAYQFFLPSIAGSGELVIVIASLLGAGLAFLWFNAYPAQLFMGDVGALALGALLGFIACSVKQELLLFIMGGIFVVETLSVILQVGSYKLAGKRIFKMSPIHHHFELKGWAETKVVMRFWIITVCLILLGLITLAV